MAVGEVEAARKPGGRQNAMLAQYLLVDYLAKKKKRV